MQTTTHAKRKALHASLRMAKTKLDGLGHQLQFFTDKWEDVHGAWAPRAEGEGDDKMISINWDPFHSLIKSILNDTRTVEAAIGNIAQDIGAAIE